jgi:tagatose-1,6-bisphosphate aldolase
MSPSSNSLQDIAGPDGTFAVVAIDQRNTLKRMYAAAGRPDVTDDELISFKADVLGCMDNASAACRRCPGWAGARPPAC